VIRVPLPAMRGSAKALGGTINDLFVAGAVVGAVRYHDRRDTPLAALNISFVVRTRDTGGADTNAFAPTRVQVPAGPVTVEERFAAIRTILAVGRQGARAGGRGRLPGAPGRRRPHHPSWGPRGRLSRSVRAALSPHDDTGCQVRADGRALDDTWRTRRRSTYARIGKAGARGARPGRWAAAAAVSATPS
jgi:hypothetical protein